MERVLLHREKSSQIEGHYDPQPLLSGLLALTGAVAPLVILLIVSLYGS